jgi:hypothetical protein
MMEAVRTSETSVDNNFTRQYIPEDNSEHLLPDSSSFTCHPIIDAIVYLYPMALQSLMNLDLP